jgi:hypothetical protein
VSQHLNDRGVYVDYQESWDDRHKNKSRAEAFDKENFGECKELYFNFAEVKSSQSDGGYALELTMKFLFSSDEKDKVDASEKLKKTLSGFEGSMSYDNSRKSNCPSAYARLKEILNAVIEAAPGILEEKQRTFEIAQEAKTKAQSQAIEKAKLKEQADAKEKADMQAMQLAEAKGREERANKLKACQSGNAYKLYETSVTINNNRVMANNARLAIQQQEEGAKVSGYVNKNVMYKAGNIIAEAESVKKGNFELYKKLGGTAWTIDSVEVLPNPCDM